jgi:hypothetical protein
LKSQRRVSRTRKTSGAMSQIVLFGSDAFPGS